MTLANIPQDIRNEFTVDADGKVYAKSVSAIARLAGLTTHSLLNDSRKNKNGTPRGLLQKLADANDLPKTLQPALGFKFNPAQNVPDYIVSCIINYYAWEADSTNDTARENALAMSAIGFRTWFQQALGWSKPEANQLSTLDTVKILREYADTLEQKEKLETKYPGLKTLTGDVEQVASLPPSFTIRQWLAYRGQELDIAQCKNFGKLVANTKRSLSQLMDLEANSYNHKLYSYSDLDLLDTSWLTYCTSFFED